MKNPRLYVVSIMAACLFFAGCHKDQDTTSAPAKVKVHVSGFSVGQQDLSGTKEATPVVSYSGVNAVTLAFYNGSTEVEKITQLKADASTYTTFGDFECSLPMGSYTMVAVAYTTKEGNPIVLTSPTLAAYTGLHAYETFVCTQTVSITNTSDVEISATLNRIVSKLQVISTDGKTEAATNVRMTMSAGGKDFNPTTGMAVTNSGFVNTVGISAATGSPSNSNTFLFLATDEQTMDVTIDVLDADGNSISHKVVTDVPFKRNRATILTGSLYSSSAGSDLTLNTEWLSEYHVSF